MNRIRQKSIILAISLLFFACDDHKFTGGHTTTTEGGSEAENLIASSCSSCHSASRTFPNLSGDLCDLATEINAQSGMSIITLGNPEESYLYHKISGTAGEVGGNASIMPPTGALSAEEIQVIFDWIKTENTCSSE